jgi:hypothetical protein
MGTQEPLGNGKEQYLAQELGPAIAAAVPTKTPDRMAADQLRKEGLDREEESNLDKEEGIKAPASAKVSPVHGAQLCR